MINTANIAGTDGSVMVPVVNETGSLMAWLLYPNPTGVLQDYYPCKTTPRPFSDHSLTTPWQYSMGQGTGAFESLRQGISLLHNQYKELHSWAGQLFIQSSKPGAMRSRPVNTMLPA